MKVEDFSDDELQLMRLGFKTPHQLHCILKEVRKKRGIIF